MKRPKLSTPHDFEYAIKWEELRSEYFRLRGQVQLAELSNSLKHELEWRLALLNRKNSDQPTDQLTNAGWYPRSESFTHAGWSTDAKITVSA